MDRNDWLDIEPFSIDTDKKDWFNADLTDEQLKGLKKIEKVNAIINRIYYAVLQKVQEEQTALRMHEKAINIEIIKLTEKISFLNRQNIGAGVAIALLAVKVFFF